MQKQSLRLQPEGLFFVGGIDAALLAPLRRGEVLSFLLPPLHRGEVGPKGSEG